MSDFVTYNDVSPRVGIHAVAKMLTRVEPQVLLSKFAMLTPLPKNKGEIIKWRRIRPLAISTVNLTEGQTPPPSQLVYEDVTTVIGQFGGLIQITDKITDLHEDRVLDDAMTALSDQAASTTEMIIWGILRAGTSVFYANGASRAVVNTPLDLDLVRAGVQFIKRNHGKKITTRLAAGPDIATEPVNSSFLAVSHIDTERDWREMASFVPVEKYSNFKPVDEDFEIGKVDEVRVLLTPQLIPFYASGSATLNGMISLGAANVDVYATVLLGRDAYGVVPLKGVNSVDMAVTNPKMGTPGDPLGQRGNVAWKMWFQAVRLNENWMTRLEHGATAVS